ncbi:MAG TPA: serine hydrolase domain-containing protein [Bacteroidota bacterium]|nr:serine hydrolase domain-containing protein [Bacteroidota bacterium]
MKLHFFSFLLTVGLVHSAMGQAPEAVSDSISAQLTAGIEGFKEQYHSPSFVIVIVHDTDMIYSKALGYTDLEKNIPATIDSKYPILSLTKPFTATMLMQLKERNIVGLNDDVKRYLPEYEDSADPTGVSGTTLFQLATHTAGLPRNSQADIGLAKQLDEWLVKGTNISTIAASTKNEFLTSLKFVKPEYPPFQFMRYGERHYSNLGYCMLGIALERAAGTDYASYVIANICRPLKMYSTGFIAPGVDPATLAQGYYYDDSAKALIRAPAFEPNSAIYAGGMYSTAADLAKFIRFQLETGTASNVLSDEDKAMMQSFHMDWISSYPFLDHDGAMLGFKCEIVFSPVMNVGWVILTNTTDFDFSGVNNCISRLILPSYRMKPITDSTKFTGTYVLAGGLDSLTISLKDGRLYSTYLEKVFAGVPLVPAGFNRFAERGRGKYNVQYDFVTDDGSNVKALNMDQMMWIKR